MISIISQECYKLWHKRNFLLLLILLFLTNFALFAYQEHQQSIPISAYQKLQQDLLKLPNDERYTFICEYDDKIQAFSTLQQIQNLQSTQNNENLIASIREKHPNLNQYRKAFQQSHTYYTDNLEQEAMFMQEIRTEMNTLHQYPDMLQEIEEKAASISSISIFTKQDTFSLQNIKKTADDFKNMKDTTITYQLQKGIQDATSFVFTDFCIILIVFAIAISMILDEKSKRLFSIIRPCKKGQWPVIFSKCIVLLLSMAIITILFQISNLCYMNSICDFGDLHASMLSLADHIQSTLPISIETYLLLFICIKWLAVCFIGYIMLAITILSRNKAACIAGILTFLSIELACYLYIPDNTAFQIFKYVNVISFLRTDIFFQKYLNINILQHAISLQHLSFLVLMIALVCSILMNCIFYKKCKYMQLSEIKLPFRIASHHKTPISYTLWKQECYKLFIIQKGFIILIFMLCLQSYIFQNKQIYLTAEEQLWITYMHTLRGSPTEEKDAWIKQQLETFSTLHKQAEDLQKQLKNQTITNKRYMELSQIIDSKLYSEPYVQNIIERYQYVKEDKHRQLFAPFVYQRLFFDKDLQIIPGIIALIFLIFLLSNFECMEHQNQMYRILQTTPNGRKKLYHHKLMIGLLSGALITFLAFIFDFMLLYQSYGFPCMQASITSLPEFSNLPASMTILQFMILGYACKLFMIETSVCILFAISKIFKHPAYVMLILMIFIIVPLILNLMGIHLLDGISYYSLCNSADFFTNGSYTLLFTTILYLFLSIASIVYMTKKR